MVYCNGIFVAKIKDENCDQSLDFEYDMILQGFDQAGYYYGVF